jgi:hypothetical protein
MDASAPTFITNRELDLFLGGGERGPRKRQRLRRENRLPHPADIGRVNRINVAIFPRFALAGLVGDLTRLNGASECLTALTQQAFALRVFSQLADAVLVSVRAMDGWRFDQLVDDVGERAQPAVAEWNAAISAAESELHQRFGIVFSTAFGVVEHINSGICVVSLTEGGSQTFEADRVAAPVEKGRAVAIERVRVMDSETNFVLPSTADIPDAQDRELASWFGKMMAAPTTAPTPTVPDDSTAEPLPYTRRSAPRRARWRGASTMTRAPSAG